MTKPDAAPLGLALSAGARVVSRAFGEALDQAGGSLPVWLVLLNLTIGQTANQRELADAVGVREATLTHHLNAMERDGLVVRRRDPDNRRIHVVALTAAGRELFATLREVALAFDTRLRAGITDADARAFSDVLERLVSNVGETPDARGPWRGLAEPAGGPAPTV